MTEENKNPLQALMGLNEEQLAKFLASDPDFLRRATRAVSEAKKKIDEEKIREKIAAAPSEQAAKLYPKAVKLVQSAFNEANEKALREMISQGLALDWKPEGSPSLLLAALEYLGTKERVEIDWPDLIVRAGCSASPEDIAGMVRLFKERHNGSLGAKANALPGILLAKPGDWTAAEALCQKKHGQDFRLARFLFDTRSNGYQSRGFALADWQAMGQIVASGCQKPPSDDKNSYRSKTFWQHLGESVTLPSQDDPSKPLSSEQKALRADALLAKQETFRAMCRKNWIDEPFADLTDNLAPTEPESHKKTGASRLCTTPTRGFVAEACVDEAFFPIFVDLCDHEADTGAARKYDSVGRTRLYFINERLRNAGRHRQVACADALLKAASEALARGDDPQSVNAQNYCAKASTQEMVDLLVSWNERLSLGAIGEGSAPKSKKPSSSL